jgi:hypothetical protein
MRINMKQVDLAILKIFYENRIRINEGLDMKSLLDSWLQTQLRQKDLYAGLSHLSSLGYIEPIQQGNETVVMLKEAGVKRIKKEEALLREMTNLITGRYLSSLLKRFFIGSRVSVADNRRSDAMGLR